MTDTKNIAALRAESANLMILLHKEGLGGEVTLTAAQFFDDVFRLLEAESARGDASEGFWGRAAARETNRATKAYVEIEELKAKLATPVVMPELPLAIGDFTAAAMKAVRRLDVQAIQKAGFTVKGEE